MLLPELDHKATIERVKRFFEKRFSDTTEHGTCIICGY